MAIELKVYDNGDHTCLVWLPADGAPIVNCRGFAIRRIKNGKEDYLHGFVGFSDTDKLDPARPWLFPLQRFMWWDYQVALGDTVQYSVVPVTGPSKDKLALDDTDASPLTPEMKISAQCTPHISSYFNKGIVAAQWVARSLASAPKNSSIKNLVATPDNKVRNALSGLLRPEILSLLTNTKARNGKIYAALYELNDPELIPALEAFGKDCNLILANGAFKKNDPPDNDENAAVRTRLKSTVNVFDRLVTLGHFGHNKFVVFCDSEGTPQRVLTGSTNWTSSGLCTQANNGLIIDDPDVAQNFLDAWKRLQAAGNNYTAALVAGNSTAKTFRVDGCKVTPWFVKTSAAQDLEYARKLINAAREGILFLFFNPGSFQEDPKRWTLLQNILDRHNPENKDNFKGDLYFCGVVNQDIPHLTKLDPTSASPVTLYKNGMGSPQPLSHAVLVPHNIKSQFDNWEKELLGASMVNIHSKVIVLDPFGENPVVMTGSHNLGLKASSANDDNLVIIEGNAPLAAAYAINIVAIFQNYRWNSYVEAHRQDPKVWHGLVDDDQWQGGYLKGDELAELKFWLGEKPAGSGGASPSASDPPSAPGFVARTISSPAASPSRKAKRVPAKRTGVKKSAAKAKKAVKKPKPKKSSPKAKSARRKPPAKRAKQAGAKKKRAAPKKS